jgi:hypothetical protein
VCQGKALEALEVLSPEHHFEIVCDLDARVVSWSWCILHSEAYAGGVVYGRSP